MAISLLHFFISEIVLCYVIAVFVDWENEYRWLLIIRTIFEWFGIKLYSYRRGFYRAKSSFWCHYHLAHDLFFLFVQLVFNHIFNNMTLTHLIIQVDLHLVNFNLLSMLVVGCFFFLKILVLLIQKVRIWAHLIIFFIFFSLFFKNFRLILVGRILIYFIDLFIVMLMRVFYFV